jgi:putative transposase
MTGHKIAPICRALGIGRATAYRTRGPRARRYARADDRVVTAQIRAVIRSRASYGYRRVRALVNRASGTRYNAKRVRRVMQLNGWVLARPSRRRTGRAHTGRIRRDGSNERWCSDSVMIGCWNGEVVELGFVLDCCDRECLAALGQPHDLCGADIRELMRRAVAARFGEGQPAAPVQWLSDNESMYTARETVIAAERLNLVPITTPARSPQSNGMSEAFVNPLRRDYIAGADLATAAAVLEQVPAWIADYNVEAPHSALGYQSPVEYRAARSHPGSP